MCLREPEMRLFYVFLNVFVQLANKRGLKKITHLMQRAISKCRKFVTVKKKV
jgi:hypothetical protein